MSEICPCDQNKMFSDCCAPLIESKKTASSAEELVRSRYTAFYLQRKDYLIETQHPSTRGPSLDENLEKNFSETSWKSLRILEATTTGNEASVEFVAFFTLKIDQNTVPQQVHEKGRFVFENDRWYYVDGDFLPNIKLNRNDPCWCGSGKKLKKCHF